MSTKERVFLWAMVAAAGLNGLGHQLQIQDLKARVSTSTELRLQDAQRTRAAIDDVYMRCRLLMEVK